ncbi:MAG: hypothetical protein NBV56_03045 [Aquirufa antheringensis]|nr:hypothetical protein [Aquirufa antheringensis]
MSSNIEIILEVIGNSDYPITSKQIFSKIKERNPEIRITKSQLSSLLWRKELKVKLNYNRENYTYCLSEKIVNQSPLVLDSEKLDLNSRIIEKKSNVWQENEIILALELYFDSERGSIDKSNPKVVKLSQLLNNFSFNRPDLINTSFRSPSSVALKLTNFLAIDPNYSGSGMSSYSKLDSELFFRFYKNTQLLRDRSKEIREKNQKQFPNKSTYLPKSEMYTHSRELKSNSNLDSKSLSNDIKLKRDEVEHLPISERCKNIITSIGGLSEAYNYYKKNKNFGDVRNCGKLTDSQLCQYFESFSEPVSKLTYHQKISFKELDLGELSERAYNVISNFGDFTDALNFYQKTKSFISINNCGSKTNLELVNLVENFLSKNPSQSQSTQKKLYSAKNIFESIYMKLTEGNTFPNVEKKLNFQLLESRDSLWQKLSFLDEKTLIDELDLSDESDFVIEFSDFLKFFKKFIRLNELNILTFGSPQIKETNINLSVLLHTYSKSLSRQPLDIQEYFVLLNQFYSNEQIIKIFLFNDIVINSKKENNSLNQFVNELHEELIKIKEFFLMDNTESDLNPLKAVLNNFSREKSIEYLDLLNGNSIVEIILFLITSSIQSHSKICIINKLFFDENYEGATLELIASEHNLSRERVRQIKSNTSRGIINPIFNYLIKINNLNFDGIDNHFLIIDKHRFFKNEYLDNDLINQLIAINFSQIINLHEFIEVSRLNNVVINSEDAIFINTNLISETELFDFLFRLNNDTDFDNEGYLKSLINYNKILDIREFIDLFSFKKSKFKAIEKENKEKIIVNELRKYLKIAGKPVKTEKLLNYLISENFVIKRYELLTYLNNEKDLFTIFGQGNWALISWRELGMLDGSLIEIIKDLLNESKEPLHISEIYYFLNEFAPTSIHSIISNLKISDTYKFQFFNCSFIGLKEKNYSNYYHSLPIVVGFHFNQSEIDKLNLSSWDDILQYYEQEYGYPRIHVEYLLINNFDV